MQVRTRKFRSGRFCPITSLSHCKFVPRRFCPMYIHNLRIKMFFFTFLDVFIFNVL